MSHSENTTHQLQGPPSLVSTIQLSPVWLPRLGETLQISAHLLHLCHVHLVHINSEQLQHKKLILPSIPYQFVVNSLW